MQAEKDEDTLSTLFKELNHLLEKKEQQFAEDTKRDPLLPFG
jgi:hypothetical protein